MKYLVLLLSLSLLINCSPQKPEIQAPEAKKVPNETSIHDETLVDNYFWMRLSDEQKEAETPDEQTQDVLDYLNAENAYTTAKMSHTSTLQEELYNEITGRIKQDDSSVPVSYNGYTYYNRYEEGQDYALYCRKENTPDAEEEIMLNGPEMAEGQSYFAIGGRSVSENNELLAYSTDLVSRRRYTIHIKNLKTGELLEDKIENTTGRMTWANDNQTFFYTKKDPVTLRSHKIYRHKLGTDPSEDVLVYEETDETFSCFVYKTKSRKYLMIGSSQTLSTEYRFLDADNPEGEWKVIQPRERDLEYFVAHYKDHFYIRTNLDAKNFRLMKAPVASPSKDNWEEVIPHRSNVLFQGMDLFRNYMVVNEREDGLVKLRVIPWSGGESHNIEFEDAVYEVYTYANPEFETETLRFSYASFATPDAVYDYQLDTRERVLKKQYEVLGDKFDPENYTTERIFATARDGAKIPISMVYRKGFEKNGKGPLLLYGYGSYGNIIDPWFSYSRISLLDRGFAFAVAHVRGSETMGRDWYENGKLLQKKNTFYDFIDAGKFLVENGYTSPEHLYAQGGSAGGLLMGAIVNMEPGLWNGVIAQVPFVDVINTMLDETIPLTTFEFDEWGNPKNKEYFDYIKSYSPYDNVEAKAYPNLLVTTGYWDSQVQYWEPAKWTARLREYKTDDNLLLLKCDMEVGHGGASGRFKRFKEVALEYAFLLDLEGISK